MKEPLSDTQNYPASILLPSGSIVLSEFQRKFSFHLGKPTLANPTACIINVTFNLLQGLLYNEILN